MVTSTRFSDFDYIRAFLCLFLLAFIFLSSLGFHRCRCCCCGCCWSCKRLSAGADLWDEVLDRMPIHGQIRTKKKREGDFILFLFVFLHTNGKEELKQQDLICQLIAQEFMFCFDTFSLLSRWIRKELRKNPVFLSFSSLFNLDLSFC
jgi:hypothetical protein